MPTNYVFGGIRPATTPQIKTSFSQGTQDLGAGVKSRAVSPQQTAQTTPIQTSLVGDTVSLQTNKNNELNQFGQNITQMQQYAQQKKQAEDQAAQQSAVKTGGFQQSNYDNSGVTPVDNTVYSGPASSQRQHLVSQAEGLLGTPYAWGGGGYGNRGSRGTGYGTENVVGVDCSGLTSYAYSQIGIRLPRVAAGQLTTTGYKTNVNNLAPGDLVGWNGLGHVAMYIGNGRIVESPHAGATVRIRALGASDTNRGVFGVHIKLPGE